MSSDTPAQESAPAGAGVAPAEAVPQVAPENSIAASAPVPAVPAAPSSAPDEASAAVPAKTEAQANAEVDPKATEPSATESSIAAAAPVANVPAPSNSTPAEASGATPVNADATATEASATETPPQAAVNETTAATTSSGDVEMKPESQTGASETQTTSEGNKPSDASETPKRDEAAPFEPVDDGTDDFTTRSKKRYVIMMGYSGIGYKGLQINKDEETIEKALEEAIVASGVIKEENAGDLKKSNWSRAARTDKGVHAVGQTISLKMGLKDHPRHIQAFIEAVNAKLPDQIKVFNVLRTTKSFNCKLQCNGRKYEYLLPVYLFRPRPFKKQDTNAAPAASDASPAVAKEVAEEGASKSVAEDGPELATKPISREEKQALFFQNFRKESIEMTPDMPADALERLKTVLNLYVGTRNYHNFTPKMAFNNGAAKRYITAIEVDGPFTIKGTKVIRVTLEGQSFVLNQIRKMIGTAVEVVRRGLDPSILEAFFENIKLPTPMIPGEGLALRACLFTPYNNRYGGGEVPGAVSSAANPRYNSIDFDHEPVKSRADAFRETILYPTMVEQDEKNSVWAKYIYNQDSAVFPPVAQVAEPEGPEAAAKRAKEKNELAKRRRRDGDPNGPGKNKRSRTGNSGGAPRGQGARGGRGGHGRGNGVMDEVKSFLSSNKY